MNLKIKTKERGTEIHYKGVFDDHTLCGLDINGDVYLRIEAATKVDKRVNCQDCLKIVRYCQSLPKLRQPPKR